MVRSRPHHGQRLVAAEHAVDVADDLSYVVVGDLAGPACADTFGTVHQHSGDDGHVPLRLHPLIVVVVVLEQIVIHGREKKAGEGAGRTGSREENSSLNRKIMKSKLCEGGTVS